MKRWKGNSRKRKQEETMLDLGFKIYKSKGYKGEILICPQNGFKLGRPVSFRTVVIMAGKEQNRPAQRMLIEKIPLSVRRFRHALNHPNDKGIRIKPHYGKKKKV